MVYNLVIKTLEQRDITDALGWYLKQESRLLEDDFFY